MNDDSKTTGPFVHQCPSASHVPNVVSNSLLGHSSFEYALAYITHADCVKHDMGDGHPECPDRVRLVHDYLQHSTLLTGQLELQAVRATKQQLARVHPENYIHQVHQMSPTSGRQYLDPDTSMNEFSLGAALLAAGAGVQAVDLILAQKAKRVFCNVRPPGHHAEPDRSMGFCIFNNIAIAAAHALEHGIERVAIIDWDVHHGNGTETWVASESRALMLGSFQHPFYPGTGDQALASNIFNAPLLAGSDGVAMRAAVLEQWWPRLNAFAPQLIFISAGFDAHRDDSMSALQWDDSDYEWLSEQVKAMANQFCSGRLVSMLEGGYDLSALQRCVADHVRSLSN